MVRRPSSRSILPLLAAALLAGCAASAQRATAPAAATTTIADATPAHDLLNATLWMQASAEYAAATTQVFRQACDALPEAVANAEWSALPAGEQGKGFESLPPAVIADLDETLLDNSPYQARRVLAGGGYTPESWRAWTDEARARAVPGALEFAECAARHGVTLVYVSNRKDAGEFDATVANLRALGFPVPADAREVVLLRGDARAPAREKGERRRWVAGRYRVVQLMGDNLGDFLDGVDATPAEREAMVLPYAAWWGRRWFMLPNPSYGSWEDVLAIDCATPGDRAACKRAALRTE